MQVIDKNSSKILERVEEQKQPEPESLSVSKGMTADQLADFLKSESSKLKKEDIELIRSKGVDGTTIIKMEKQDFINLGFNTAKALIVKSVVAEHKESIENFVPEVIGPHFEDELDDIPNEVKVVWVDANI